MPGPLAVAEERYRSGVELSNATERAAQRLWRRYIDARNLDASFARLFPLLRELIVRAQLRGAEGSMRYLDRVLKAQGIDLAPAGDVNPGAFAGWASDGRDLDGLLHSPVASTKQAIGDGMAVREALLRGQFALRLIAATQVADAARVADGVAIAATPGLGGYVRMLNLPSCARCAILAGKYYRWNQGFQRHPACDCRHIPASEDVAGDLLTDPEKAVASGKVTGLTRADRQALAEGADLNQIVNAKRGIRSAGGRQFTIEGTTSRGIAGQRLGDLRSVRGSRYRRSGVARITPEQIYRDATSREDAIRLLRMHGYII
jgi:hypothetical protein